MSFPASDSTGTFDDEPRGQVRAMTATIDRIIISEREPSPPSRLHDH
ncbi:hypothetical protein SAZ_25465 [Streptomyces noursei ZPM]|nr:hypothetical protein SAZ_25465 [Streptomyces noursei ZPM]